MKAKAGAAAAPGDFPTPSSNTTAARRARDFYVVPYVLWRMFGAAHTTQYLRAVGIVEREH